MWFQSSSPGISRLCDLGCVYLPRPLPGPPFPHLHNGDHACGSGLQGFPSLQRAPRMGRCSVVAAAARQHRALAIFGLPAASRPLATCLPALTATAGRLGHLPLLLFFLLSSPGG
jgi:hypothetical protein